ncbi:hypothetical protein AVEN_142964-1 [Araneus ventricosus]|uniref:Uncharacterized protein n=1 Tax=Araneus ventricosus TaxID=182803 RepID=A0A4Y2MDJ8_ARAVE|nr:hypothetical protein AVEN_142964-1 [Araneus ventricosus]
METLHIKVTSHRASSTEVPNLCYLHVLDKVHGNPAYKSTAHRASSTVVPNLCYLHVLDTVHGNPSYKSHCTPCILHRGSQPVLPACAG